MALDSPVVILYDASGNPFAVQNGVATPASTPGLHVMGSDGTISRYLLVDSSGRPVVAGAGVAGTPAGGVVSVQGVAGGQAIPVSGTFSAANVGTNGAAIPGSSGQIGISDGTNLQAARGFDLDTGAGTEYNQGVSLRLPGSGGSTAGGTSGNPLRTDPTGTTTQPISATALPLPTGAATETTLAGVLTTTAFQARINTLGAKTSANSTPVVLASDQATLPISAASLPLPAGAATEATLGGVLTTTAFQARINTLGSKTSANSTPVVIASDQGAIPVTTPTSATATRSDVTSVAASATILASNASRKGAIIYNDSNKSLYLKFGTTATVTDFTTLLRAGDQYEVPFGYTGRIDGIWSAANGAARVTELT